MIDSVGLYCGMNAFVVSATPGLVETIPGQSHLPNLPTTGLRQAGSYNLMATPKCDRITTTVYIDSPRTESILKSTNFICSPNSIVYSSYLPNEYDSLQELKN